MILDSLTLHNFGLYRGRHVLTLPSPSRQTPVTTVLALNGSGKTTLLDALRLAFYGRRTPASPRAGVAYEAYLRECIHRATPATEGAAIEVAFRLRTEGVMRSYRLHRSWAQRTGAVRERLELYVEGALDPALTENWDETIEQWLPARLSAFCFFDGEQLEALAHPDKSKDALRDAIHTLLGLDVVDQLVSDLKTLERRRRERVAAPAETQDLAPLDSALDDAEAGVQQSLHEHGQWINALGQARQSLAKAEARFSSSGGGLREKLNALDGERRAVLAEIQVLEGELRQLAAGIAPLLMVRSQLVKDKQAPQMLSVNRRALGLLEKRDEETLQHLTQLGGTAALVKALRQFLRNDRATREPRKDSGAGLEDPDQLFAELDKAATAIRTALARLSSSRKRLDEVDSLLSRVPTEDAVEAPRRQWEEALREVGRVEALAGQSEQALVEARRNREDAAARRDKALERHTKEQLSQEKGMLAQQQVDKVRSVLASFREKVVQKHAGRLGELIVDCFNQLHRKPGLVQRVVIDVMQFSMLLYTENNEVIPAEKLSAGERQLLATATIWAILRASGRPLPLVIDTPLGRLDSVHRQSLLARFFSQVSHQVILLATDTELDAAVQVQLAPLVAAEYDVLYDAAARASRLIGPRDPAGKVRAMRSA